MGGLQASRRRRANGAGAGGGDVAFAWALLKCGRPDDITIDGQFHPLRLTFGLVKRNGVWLVTHEHHSFTDLTSG